MSETTSCNVPFNRDNDFRVDRMSTFPSNDFKPSINLRTSTARHSNTMVSISAWCIYRRRSVDGTNRLIINYRFQFIHFRDNDSRCNCDLTVTDYLGCVWTTGPGYANDFGIYLHLHEERRPERDATYYYLWIKRNR